MEFRQKRVTFKRSPKRQILRIESNIKEIRDIFHDLRSNSESTYKKVESSVEIVKIIKLLELERQVVEFNDILEKVVNSENFCIQEQQENSPASSLNQENSPPETLSSDQETEQDPIPKEISE